VGNAGTDGKRDLGLQREHRDRVQTERTSDYAHGFPGRSRRLGPVKGAITLVTGSEGLAGDVSHHVTVELIPAQGLLGQSRVDRQRGEGHHGALTEIGATHRLANLGGQGGPWRVPAGLSVGRYGGHLLICPGRNPQPPQ